MNTRAYIGAILASTAAVFWSICDRSGDGRLNMTDYLPGSDKNKDGVMSGSESASATIVPVSFLLLAIVLGAQAFAAIHFLRSALVGYKRNVKIQKTVIFPDSLDGSLLEYVDSEFVDRRSSSRATSRASSRKSSIISTVDFKRAVSELTHQILTDQSFMDTLDEDILRWDFDTFDLAEKTDQPLVMVGIACLEAGFDVDVDIDKLWSFLRDLNSSYNDVIYHNSLHGATVARSAFCMCKEMGLGAKLSARMQFALVLAGLIHDVGHPGLTAQFLEKAEDELSLKYSDDSPLERMHLSVAFGLLRKPENSFLDREDLQAIKAPITHAVLGTDMAKHGQHMQRLDALLDNLSHGGSEGAIPWYFPAKPPPSCKTPEQKSEWELQEQEVFIMGLFLHAADIASPTMPFDQFKRWNALVQQEFWAQGDREKAEFGTLISVHDGYDRTVSPLRVHIFTCGFLDYVVQPYFQKLNSLSKIDAINNVASHVDLSVCLSNLERNGKMLKDTAPSAQ